MRRLYIALILMGITASAIFASRPEFHRVKVKKGDGILSLLKRYQLADSKCNVEKFYELNELTAEDPLIISRKYFIPVYIYKYDGKSIRSSIQINDWNRAVKIKSYNEYLQKNKLRKTSYTSSKLLWVPYGMVDCNEGIISTENAVSIASAKIKKEDADYVHESLFGKKYADVNIEDESLSSKVYYIVSGHGGPDPGARCVKCPDTLCEDEYAYDVALRLARNLMQHGANVHIIIQDKNDGIRDAEYLACDKDEVSNSNQKIPLNQVQRLKQRSEAINKLYYQYKKKGITDQQAVFIHVDSNSKNTRQDVFFYHHKNSKSGKKLAHNIKDTFGKKYQKFQKGRGYKGFVKSRSLYVLRNTVPTGIFIELANIRNKNDHRRLLISSNRQALANWIFEGLTTN